MASPSPLSTAQPPRTHRAVERRRICGGIAHRVGQAVQVRKPASHQSVRRVDRLVGRAGTWVALCSGHDEARRSDSLSGTTWRTSRSSTSEPTTSSGSTPRPSSVRLDPTVLADPYPLYARLRVEDPDPPHAPRPMGPHPVRRRGRGPPRSAVRPRGVRAALRRCGTTGTAVSAVRTGRRAPGSRCFSATHRATRGSATSVSHAFAPPPWRSSGRASSR